MGKRRFLAVPMLVLALSVSLAFTVSADDLTGSLEAFRVVVNEDGVEEFLSADNARPDDVIEYRLTYTNSGDDPLKNVFITDPIPVGTVLIHPSATRPTEGRVEFSIDGGKDYKPWPILIKEMTEDGEEKVVEATPDMVTHVRWVLTETILPENGITVSYRTVVK